MTLKCVRIEQDSYRQIPMRGEDKCLDIIASLVVTTQ